MGKLLRTSEVSEMLGIPEATLRWYRHQGEGGPRSFTLGLRRVVYKEEDVLAWVEAQYQQAS